MPRRKEPAIPNELLDQLLAGGGAGAAFVFKTMEVGDTNPFDQALFRIRHGRRVPVEVGQIHSVEDSPATHTAETIIV